MREQIFIMLFSCNFKRNSGMNLKLSSNNEYKKNCFIQTRQIKKKRLTYSEDYAMNFKMSRFLLFLA